MHLESNKEFIINNVSVIEKLRKLWPYYILQSFLACISLFILILILGQDKIVIISAMGATAFIVFAMPTAASAQTRNVVGGHFVGILTGTIFYYTPFPSYIEYPLVVGIAIFIMVAFDFEHPPAAGTALAVVINEVSLDAFPTIIVAAIVLSQCRFYLRRKLRNLV